MRWRAGVLVVTKPTTTEGVETALSRIMNTPAARKLLLVVEDNPPSA